MKVNNSSIIILAVSIVFFGFSLNVRLDRSNPFSQNDQAVVVGSDVSPELKRVEEEFNKIESKDDKLLIHKLFAGAAEYLMVARSLNSTHQFDPILGRVQSSYGWDREKYPRLTDAVSDYLIAVDYVTPRKLETKEDRVKFAKIFDNLAEVTKNE